MNKTENKGRDGGMDGVRHIPKPGMLKRNSVSLVSSITELGSRGNVQNTTCTHTQAGAGEKLR